MRFAAAVAVGCLATGCAMPEHGPEPAGERTAVYACEDGTGFTVRFAPNGETATVELADTDRPLVLPIQPSGSGFHYATPRHSLRGKGDEAQWTVGRRTPTRCVAE